MIKHLPRKNCQVNRIRALLLNINDGTEVTYSDFGIDETEFNSYFLALQQTGYIILQDKQTEFVTTSYTICDIEKFMKIKSNGYKIIPQIIIPVLKTILSCVINIA